jgi:NADPH:quinone reductase-like Zn-dependent oxidoreductase
MSTEAMVLEKHGDPSVLERRTIDLPPLGAREVRVRVRAVALNHLDLWVRRGGPAFKLQYPHRLGSDIAGEVEEIGPGVTNVAAGDRVLIQPGLSCGTCQKCLSGRDNLCKSYRILGENTQGGYARHIHVPDVNAVKIGPDLGFVDAAAAPLCTLTAWQMVVAKGQVKAGQTVLVHAAGSGVSTVIIQLCKLLGARVLATTTVQEKVARAREVGADEVILTSEQDYVAQVKKLTNREGPDVIFDHVGGELLEKAVTVVGRGGRIVTCGATANFVAKLDMRHVFFRQVEILGSTMGSKSMLLDALPFLQSGALRPVIDRVMPLWEARAAHELLEGRKVFGKVVLTVD